MTARYMTNESTARGRLLSAIARTSGAVVWPSVFLGILSTFLAAVAVADDPAPAPAAPTPLAVTARPIEALIEQGTLAMRTDPEASRRNADEAIALLQKNPDPDLEIRARLLLCDYQSERDTAAAQREIALALSPEFSRLSPSHSRIPARRPWRFACGSRAVAAAISRCAAAVSRSDW